MGEAIDCPWRIGGVSEPTDIVFLEGWCLGFERLREFESLISSVDARVYFAPINEYLMEYESVFNSAIDSWMVIKAAIGDGPTSGAKSREKT